MNGIGGFSTSMTYENEEHHVASGGCNHSELFQTKVTEMSAILKGVNHPIRLSILAELALKNEVNVGRLVCLLSVSQSSISQHLAKMRALGIVNTKRAGKQVIYYIADPFVSDLVKFFFEKELEQGSL